jgi:uncharacterized protein YndB with AHSA1/START domain
MSSKAREPYTPGPPAGASVEKRDGEQWDLVLTRTLRHPPEKVWAALTEPEHLSQWSPFDADGSLARTGAKVKLTTVNAPKPHVTETTVQRAEPMKTLVFNWGGNDMRWNLERIDDGTRLTLWTSINRHFIAMGAAGWHLCLDVLDHLLDGDPIGRIAGPDAMKVHGWPQLLAGYAQQFGTQVPGAPKASE